MGNREKQKQTRKEMKLAVILRYRPLMSNQRFWYPNWCPWLSKPHITVRRSKANSDPRINSKAHERDENQRIKSPNSGNKISSLTKKAKRTTKLIQCAIDIINKRAELTASIRTPSHIHTFEAIEKRWEENPRGPPHTGVALQLSNGITCPHSATNNW